ncbi:MAG: hypothetical protein J3R72DRAFT_519263 [Linnemannia gamsii]|nr:MAG: hypothetical protein J3R72DRAFT_519263 [Linnemannia gamsii]
MQSKKGSAVQHFPTNRSTTNNNNSNSNTLARVAPSKTYTYSAIYSDKNNNNNNQRRGPCNHNSNTSTPTKVDSSINNKGFAIDTSPWPQAVVIVQWKTRFEILKKHHAETMKIINYRDDIRMRLELSDLKIEQNRQSLKELEEYDRERQGLETLHEQYSQQQHQQEKEEALFPRPLIQPGNGQLNVNSFIFGQVQPQFWY